MKLSAHKGGLSFQTRLAGSCPVQGFNQDAQLSTNLGDHATGVYPIPNPVAWYHTGAPYEIKFQFLGARRGRAPSKRR